MFLSSPDTRVFVATNTSVGLQEKISGDIGMYICLEAYSDENRIHKIITNQIL
jgi:hypothetical protein